MKTDIPVNRGVRFFDLCPSSVRLCPTLPHLCPTSNDICPSAESESKKNLPTRQPGTPDCIYSQLPQNTKKEASPHRQCSFSFIILKSPLNSVE